jgi:multiple sugar transport system permease protein
MKAPRYVPWLFLAPNLVGFLAFTLIPVVASFILAFCAWDLFSPPQFVGMENFTELAGFHLREDRALPLVLFVALAAVFAGIGFWRLLASRGETAAPGTTSRRSLALLQVLLLAGAAWLFWLAFAPNNPRFWYYVYNTLFLMLGLPISIIGSLCLAILLNRRLYGRNLFRLVFFLPSIVTGVGIYILWKWIFNPDYGLINNLLWMIAGAEGPQWLNSTAWSKPALIMINLWGTIGGINMILYLAALQNINPELYEAAEIDGVGRWSQFWHITWPMVSPTTFFILIMGVIHGFQGGFDKVFVMTRGGPAGSTTTLSYFIYENGFNFFYMGRASAASWILFLMVMVFTWVNWRYGGKRVHY